MITAAEARIKTRGSKLPVDQLTSVLLKIGDEIQNRADRGLDFLIYNIRETLEQDYRGYISQQLELNGYKVDYSQTERSLKISW